jgi:hypothetical protein
MGMRNSINDFKKYEEWCKEKEKSGSEGCHIFTE